MYVYISMIHGLTFAMNIWRHKISMHSTQEKTNLKSQSIKAFLTKFPQTIEKHLRRLFSYELLIY